MSVMTKSDPELLRGWGEISHFVGMSERWCRRRAYHGPHPRLPVFNRGGQKWSRIETLRAWLASEENATSSSIPVAGEAAVAVAKPGQIRPNPAKPGQVRQHGGAHPKDILRCLSCSSLPRRKDLAGHVTINGEVCAGTEFEVTKRYTAPASPPPGAAQPAKPAKKKRKKKRTRRWRRIPDDVRAEVVRAVREGKTQTEVARSFGLTASHVGRLLRLAA